MDACSQFDGLRDGEIAVGLKRCGGFPLINPYLYAISTYGAYHIEDATSVNWPFIYWLTSPKFDRLPAAATEPGKMNSAIITVSMYDKNRLFIGNPSQYINQFRIIYTIINVAYAVK
jgi:hypothetical protein